MLSYLVFWMLLIGIMYPSRERRCRGCADSILHGIGNVTLGRYRSLPWPVWAVQVAYCEEQVECRRAVLLAHFGESFDPKRSCHGTCDVCAQHSGHIFEEVSCDHLPIQSAHPAGESMPVPSLHT